MSGITWEAVPAPALTRLSRKRGRAATTDNDAPADTDTTESIQRPKRQAGVPKPKPAPIELINFNGPVKYITTADDSEKYVRELIAYLAQQSQAVADYFGVKVSAPDRDYPSLSPSYSTCLQCQSTVSFTHGPITSPVPSTLQHRCLPQQCLGFDLEWRPSFTAGKSPNKVALLQLSTPYKCYLFQIIHCSVTPTLTKLLTCPLIGKVGVNVAGDVRKLEVDYDIRIVGAIELSSMYNQMLSAGCTRRWNFGDLCMSVLRYEMGKDKKVRLGNWERNPLNPNQVEYAATDAWAAVLVYAHLYHYHCEHAPAESAEPAGHNYTALRITAHNVPALAELDCITVAQEEVYQLWYHQQKTIEQICHLLGYSKSTCESHVQVLLYGGYAYKWELFGVEDKTLKLIKAYVAKLRKGKSHPYARKTISIECDDDEDEASDDDEADKENTDTNNVPAAKKPAKFVWPAAKDVRKKLCEKGENQGLEHSHVKWALMHLQQLEERSS